jgi:hypothetical protein
MCILLHRLELAKLHSLKKQGAAEDIVSLPGEQLQGLKVVLGYS